MQHADANPRSIAVGRMTAGQTLVLALLLAGAVVNLIAGARRPLRERALLSQGHYAAAEEARQAIERHVPTGRPVDLVVYAGDYVGAMDGSVWAVIFMRWLLYPRLVPEYRVRSEDPTSAASGPTLFFHTTHPPALPKASYRVLARGRTWVLADIPVGRAE